MLAGVGGRTIAEAKLQLSWDEHQAWMVYRAKHGPLHLGKRIEDAAALVALTVSHTIPRPKGVKGPTIQDFMLYAAKDADEEPISLDEAMATWR